MLALEGASTTEKVKSEDSEVFSAKRSGGERSAYLDKEADHRFKAAKCEPIRVWGVGAYTHLRRFAMTTLEEQFALLVAEVAHKGQRLAPDVLPVMSPQRAPRTRTVYSVGEAISQRGRDAKLGAGSNRDTGSGR